MNKKKNYLRFYISFLFFLIFFIKFSTTAVAANTYKIVDIEISEPYELNFNKEKLIDIAFKTAFEELMLKVNVSYNIKRTKYINLNIIKSLIDSFSIIDEKFIDNKYIAKFEVDFDKKQVHELLEKNNIFPSIPVEKNVFIIPVLIDSEKNQISLFSENPFYFNWNSFDENNFLLKYILPNEDLDDLNLIKKNLQNIEDYDFSEIISKYDLKDYIIVIFFNDIDKLRVVSKIYLNNNLIVSNKIFSEIKNYDNNSLYDLIRELKVFYEDEWKKINLINTSIKLPVTLSLDSKNYQLIQKFEKKLLNLDLVSNYYIEYFSNDVTIYKIIYNSSPDKFLTEFKIDNFKINTSYKIWRIE
jgi:hypothetical protein